MIRLIKYLLALALLAGQMSAWAQSDPPGRVGRIAYLENNVVFFLDRNDQGGPATLNWPVSHGARLESGFDGRAEVWIGSTAYRLNHNTRLSFVAVDDRRVSLDLSSGALAVSILDREQAADIVLSTPGGLIRFHTAGRFRITVGPERIELAAQAGQASLDTGQGNLPVSAGQLAVQTRDGRAYLETSRYQDAFDIWVANRENASLGNTARRYVSPYMTGYGDLDSYGDWQSSSEYGTVWYPRAVSADWAPYRYGRWAWVEPWGWTWIDQAPWGFAPFHYGRWVLIGPRWAWIPGSMLARPVYAPALVAWTGGPGWSVSFSFGTAPAVGWFPLGPREVYIPTYVYSPSYIQQINITHVHDVNLIERARRDGGERQFAYRAQPKAMTIVPAEHLRTGALVTSRELARADRQELLRAPPPQRAPDAHWLAPSNEARRPQRADLPHTGLERPAAPIFSRPDSPMPSENRPRENEPRRMQAPEAASGPRDAWHKDLPSGISTNPREPMLRGRSENLGAPPKPTPQERSWPMPREIVQENNPPLRSMDSGNYPARPRMQETMPTRPFRSTPQDDMRQMPQERPQAMERQLPEMRAPRNEPPALQNFREPIRSEPRMMPQPVQPSPPRAPEMPRPAPERMQAPAPQIREPAAPRGPQGGGEAPRRFNPGEGRPGNHGQ